jgi:hypothetical protein
MEEPVPVEPAGEVGAAQPGGGVAAAVPGEEAPPPPPPPQLVEVMDRQTRLLEKLVEGILHPHGGQPNDFQRKLEGFLKLRPPTFDYTDDDPIAAED